MGIFSQKRTYTKRELKEAFRRDTGAIPHTGGSKFFRAQREKLADDISKNRWVRVTRQDFRGAVDKLNRERKTAKDFSQRRQLERRANYLKKIGGL